MGVPTFDIKINSKKATRISPNHSLSSFSVNNSVSLKKIRKNYEVHLQPTILCTKYHEDLSNDKYIRQRGLAPLISHTSISARIKKFVQFYPTANIYLKFQQEIPHYYAYFLIKKLLKL